MGILGRDLFLDLYLLNLFLGSVPRQSLTEAVL
jgi:hypothetical protein